MTDIDELKRQYSETETETLLSKWSDATLLEWAETILREELLGRGFSEAKLAEFRVRKPVNKPKSASSGLGISKSNQAASAKDLPETFIIQKAFALFIAFGLFCTIMVIPFYMWQYGVDHSSASGNGSNMDFLIGMSTIIWVPVLAMVSFVISAVVARLLWPKKRTWA